MSTSAALEQGIGPTVTPADDPRLPRVLDALRSVFDPEIPVNILDLGLIYALQFTPDRVVKISMTLTSPACPVAGQLPGQVEAAVAAVPGVEVAEVTLVWDPPWSAERISETARLELGIF